MSLNAVCELSAALVMVLALGRLLGWGQERLRPVGPTLIFLLVLSAAIHLGEGLEGLGVTRLVKPIETLAIVAPATWLFLFFALRIDALGARIYTREDQLQRVLDTAPTPLVILDLELEAVASSKAWRELVGPSLGEGVREFLKGVLEQTQAEGRAGHLEPVQVDFGGQSEWVIWAASAWSKGPTEAGGVVLLLTVVSGQLEAEEATRRLQEELQRANRVELVSVVAAGVAHDVNNFLSIVSGHASLLGTDLSQEERSASLSAIRDATRLSSGLLETLTDLSRRRTPEPSPLDLVELIEQARRLLARVMQRRIRLELRLPEAPVLVNAIPIKLQQVLLNLVVNARDASQDGGCVLLALEVEAEQARLSVRDEGKGIPLELREQIFEQLFTTKGPEQGTGLGLAIVRSIVEEHRGSIEVQSELGQGSTFEIRIPLAA